MGELLLTLNGVDITSRVLWDDCSFDESADEGQLGVGTLVLRDIDGLITPLYHQAVILYDHGVVSYRGTLGQDDRGRDGDIDHYGIRRAYTFTINDENDNFDHIRVEAYKRGVETDVARLKAAFLAYNSGIDRTTYVPNTATVSMEKRLYSDGMLRDLVSDCAEDADKNYWIDRDDRLHYAVDGSLSSNVASISLTDNVANYAVNIMVVPAPSVYNVGLIVKHRDPNSIPLQNSVMLKYGNRTPPRSVTVTDATSIAAYGLIQGPPVFDQRAKGLTSATRRANALLHKSLDPEVSYSTEIALPRLDLLKAGQYIAVTSTQGGLTGGFLKVSRMTAKRKGGSSGLGYWIVGLELTNRRRWRKRPKGYSNSAVRAVAVASLEDCGSAIAKVGDYYCGEATSGDTPWSIRGTQKAGAWLGENVSWPTTPCGVGLGAFRNPSRTHIAATFTMPSDDGTCTEGQVSVVLTPIAFGHGPEGFYSGVAAVQGPYMICSSSGGPTGGVVFRTTPYARAHGDGTGTITETIRIPYGNLNFGGLMTVYVLTGFAVTKDFACVDEVLAGGVGDGACGVSIGVVQMRKPSDGTEGTLQTGAIGSQNGLNHTFTLLPSYSNVTRVWQNGIEMGPQYFTATDGSTVTTVGWCPQPSDVIWWEYHI